MHTVPYSGEESDIWEHQKHPLVAARAVLLIVEEGGRETKENSQELKYF